MTQPRRPVSERPAGGFFGCSVRATPTASPTILVDGADAVALGRFSLVVKADGRHLSKLVAFHFTVELGTWSGCTCTRTPTWSPGP